jgi:hypothetical protein
MIVFTNTDKGLMMRAGRRLADQAKALETKFGFNWAATKESREAKLEFDRLMRDDRDLRILAKRIEKAVAEEAARQAVAAVGSMKLEPEEGSRV